MQNLDEPKIAKEYDEFLERNSFDKYSNRNKVKHISSPNTLQSVSYTHLTLPTIYSV